MTDERLWPGEFVSVRLILGTRPNAVTVPAQTVMTGAERGLCLCHRAE